MSGHFFLYASEKHSVRHPPLLPHTLNNRLLLSGTERQESNHRDSNLGRKPRKHQNLSVDYRTGASSAVVSHTPTTEPQPQALSIKARRSCPHDADPSRKMGK